MVVSCPGIHYYRIYFDIFLIDRNGIGNDSLAIEIRITLRIYDDTGFILLRGNIK